VTVLYNHQLLHEWDDCTPEKYPLESALNLISMWIRLQNGQTIPRQHLYDFADFLVFRSLP